jgi:uncharacterized low-complexity protein
VEHLACSRRYQYGAPRGLDIKEKLDMSEQKMKPLAFAVGAALAGSFAGASLANAKSNDNPFQMNSLSAGFELAAMAEGSCGEGKCGGDKGGEGSCGGDKGGEGSCGGDKGGEGSCGGDKGGEGKCGEGKCGGSL